MSISQYVHQQSPAQVEQSLRAWFNLTAANILYDMEHVRGRTRGATSASLEPISFRGKFSQAAATLTYSFKGKSIASRWAAEELADSYAQVTTQGAFLQDLHRFCADPRTDVRLEAISHVEPAVSWDDMSTGENWHPSLSLVIYLDAKYALDENNGAPSVQKKHRADGGKFAMPK